MSIEFHCSSCNRLIRVPTEKVEEAAGKRGKCPYCKNSVYIPLPADQLEEIPLAPLDPQEEARRKRMKSDDIKLAASVDHETREAPEPRGSSASESALPLPRGGGAAAVPTIDCEEEIVSYVLAMRDSRLGEVEEIAGKLKRVAKKAREEIERIQVDEIPPAGLEGIPPALLKGFLRTLAERIA